MSGRPKYPAAARELLRTTLLDAVDHLLRDRPWSAVTMAAIAGDAGVSRQTVYNEFGGREGVAQAYVLREVERFVTETRAAVAEHADDPRRAIAAAFDHFLTAASEHPALRALAHADGGSDELLALLTTQGQPVLAAATEQLAVVLQETWAGVGLAEARLVAECVARLAMSYAALPGESSASLTAAHVAEIIGPYAERLLAAAARADAA